ncbi:MAG: zinc ribbon domain-containing protein [Proteobacteria bacterium]|nr:zinc ribbon domain-containing protein [Pseudomonadota bacterium]MBU1612693.1 zinc ribbon domain-containing protein [Pseudomonadota bacterium]
MVGIGLPELLVMCFVLVVTLIIPIWTANVAKGKGRNWVVWFVLGFLLNIVGLIIAYVLPVQAGGDYMKCSQCAEPVRREAKVCKHCGADLLKRA